MIFSESEILFTQYILLSSTVHNVQYVCFTNGDIIVDFGLWESTSSDYRMPYCTGCASLFHTTVSCLSLTGLACRLNVFYF